MNEQSAKAAGKTILLWALGFFGVGGLWLGGAWLFIAFLAPARTADTVAQPAKPAPELKLTPTFTVPTAPVKVYAPVAKKRLKLPETKPAEQVIAATRVPSDTRPQTVTTVLDTETGESRSFVKTEPYPWIALEPRGEARLMAGYKLDGARVKQTVRLAVGFDAVRVKALTIGVSGSLDSDGDAFVGVGLSYRW